MVLFGLTLVVIAAAMTIMAIGIFLKRPCLRGSCGGPDVVDGSGESLACAACPNRRRDSTDATSAQSDVRR